jgi:hypothetical protein
MRSFRSLPKLSCQRQKLHLAGGLPAAERFGTSWCLLEKL